MKRFALFTLSLAVVLSILAGCGKESGGGQKTVSILTPYQSSVTTNQMIEVLKSQAEAKGWKTEVIDTKGDIGQMASRMEDVITRKTDAIVIVSTDPGQLEAQIALAAEKGIPVFGCDSGYIEGMAMNATSDNAEMARMMTEYLFEQIGGEGQVLALTHRPHPGVLKRSVKLDEMLADYPGITIINELHVDVPGPIENARKQVESVLLANKEPGSIKAVWAAWDEPAIGAAQAIENAGRNEIVVAGIDGNSQAVEMIKEGSPIVATVEQNFTGMAELVIGQIEKVFAGNPVDASEMYAPARLITKDNVQ